MITGLSCTVSLEQAQTVTQDSENFQLPEGFTWEEWTLMERDNQGHGKDIDQWVSTRIRIIPTFTGLIYLMKRLKSWDIEKCENRIHPRYRMLLHGNTYTFVSPLSLLYLRHPQ